MRKILLSTLMLMLFGMGYAQPFGQAGELTKVPQDWGATGLKRTNGYIEYLPVDYDGVKKHPLLLTFQGNGEGGDGSENALNALYTHGPIKLINQGRDFEAIVISPQSSANWFSGDEVKTMIDLLLEDYPIDENRIYLTGFSAGGQGVVQMMDQYPDIPAAVVPICPAASLAGGKSYMINIPTWFFHCFNDGAVGYSNSRWNFASATGIDPIAHYPGDENTSHSDTVTFHAIPGENGAANEIEVVIDAAVPTHDFSFTLYAFGWHDAWTETYENEEMWTWMFSQSKADIAVSTHETKNEESDDLYLFPNPATSELNIILKGDLSTEKMLDLNILNAQGTVISKLKDLNKVDVSNFDSGVYYLNATTESGDTLVKSFVVE